MGEAQGSRKTPVHLPIRGGLKGAVVVFVTVCTAKRKPILCRGDAHRAVIDAWGEAESWRVGRYVMMPDHIHFFCAPATPDSPPLERWVWYWKALASRGWPRRAEQPIWQRSFWDTQLRKGERYDEKWEYVRQNPVRKGLAASADDWPYQGVLDVLEWHD